MISRGLVFRLGLGQLLCWGVSYYLIAIFGSSIARDLGWSMTLVHSGFSGALVVMGLSSTWVGRLIDRHGGRRVMVTGSLVLAAGCLALGTAQSLLTYDLAWACIGIAMRMTLYEAAFATLARIGGPSSRFAMARITLLGGLASTAFWPIGHALDQHLGWRQALVVYAGIALFTAGLHLTVPGTRHDGSPSATNTGAPVAVAPRAEGSRIAAALFATMLAVTAFLNSGMSAHMVGIIAGLGAGAGTAVWLSMLRGIGQSGARLCEVLFGRRLDPLALGMVAAALLLPSFASGLLGGQSLLAGAAFALGYGAGNGLLTIARGTQPLVLFDHRTYGAQVGRLSAPSFMFAAFAPMLYASLIERAGEEAALLLSLILAAIAAACAGLLWWLFGLRRTPGAETRYDP